MLLANATHVKNVPGRKTDVKDSEWICAAVTASAAEAKLCARHRAARFARTKPGSYHLVAERSRLKNRIQKILEDANIKLGSVASDVFGSARTPVPVQMQDGRGRQAPSSLFRAVPEDRRVTFCRPGWRSELLTLGSGSRLLSASTSTRAEDSDEVLLPEIERQ